MEEWLHNWILSAGNRFSSEAYIYWSRVQGALWTSADLVICFYLLKLGNLCRSSQGVRLHRVSFWVLGATVPFAAVIPFIPHGAAFFRLELLVTIPHFLIIAYVLAGDYHVAARTLHQLAANQVTANQKTPTDEPGGPTS